MVFPAARVPIMSRRGRRRFLKALIGLPFLLTSPFRASAEKTPTAAEGPFYPTPAMRFSDADNDLVRIAGTSDTAAGEVMVLKGRIFTPDGRPANGARIEIWQCDANGRYLHTGDRNSTRRDAAFQGFGHVVTGEDGGYAFRTIKPVPYPGRAPHIHVKVASGQEELTTQFYIAGHPLNSGDWLFRRMSDADRLAVSMVIVDGRDGPETSLDIRL